jgi:hypothetical protein
MLHPPPPSIVKSVRRRPAAPVAVMFITAVAFFSILSIFGSNHSLVLPVLELDNTPDYASSNGNSNWEHAVYIPKAPAMDAKLPVPIQRIVDEDKDNQQHSSTTVSISTLIPALPEDITKYRIDMMGSLKAQTVPADEVVIVISDVLTKANASHPEASASDWCAATHGNLVDLFYLWRVLAILVVLLLAVLLVVALLLSSSSWCVSANACPPGEHEI